MRILTHLKAKYIVNIWRYGNYGSNLLVQIEDYVEMCRRNLIWIVSHVWTTLCLLHLEVSFPILSLMYNLLIADDEQLIREGLSKSIQWKDLGYTLIGAVASTAQALAIINCSHIDVLLTDIQMPGKSGLDLLSYVKANFEQMRVIIISGYDRFEYARIALRLGAEDYLLKPIKKKQVIEQVTRIKNELDAYYSEREKFITYQKSYFFRKLLENTYLSSDELDEIIMRLEIDETASKQYVVYVFDLYKEQADNALGSILKDHLNNRIGIYSVVVLQVKETSKFEQELEDIPLIWAKGSSQSIESLCISYERAMEQLKHGKMNPLHSFKASFTEHKEIIQILEVLGQGDYERVNYFIANNFSHFETSNAAKRWCLWFMDCIELNFEKYQFTGQYQMAVKNWQNESIAELEVVFKQYIEKVYMTFDEKKKNSSTYIVEEAMKLIDTYCSDKNFSLTYVSETLGISYGYLSGIFKQEIGKKFSECLIEKRMQKAKALLLTRKYKIYEIADLCGYGNERYFSDSFKKYYGQSPTDLQMIVYHEK